MFLHAKKSSHSHIILPSRFFCIFLYGNIDAELRNRLASVLVSLDLSSLVW